MLLMMIIVVTINMTKCYWEGEPVHTYLLPFIPEGGLYYDMLMDVLIFLWGSVVCRGDGTEEQCDPCR